MVFLEVVHRFPEALRPVRAGTAQGVQAVVVVETVLCPLSSLQRLALRLPGVYNVGYLAVHSRHSIWVVRDLSKFG